MRVCLCTDLILAVLNERHFFLNFLLSLSLEGHEKTDIILSAQNKLLFDQNQIQLYLKHFSCYRTLQDALNKTNK